MLKNKKSLRFSEKELSNLLSVNKNIKCNITDLTTLTETSAKEDIKEKKVKHDDVDRYIQKIKESHISMIETEDCLYLQFDHMKLMPYNQLAQIMQYRPHMLYAYKKALKTKMFAYFEEHKTFFQVQANESVTMYLYRQSNRLVDNDTLSISFKYVIDNLRYVNIIPEDNPTIIRDIQCFQNKDKTDCIALIIKKDRQSENCLSSLDSFKSLVK